MEQKPKSLEDTISDWVSANLRLIVGVLVAFVLAWGGWAFYEHQQVKREKAAQNDLFAITDALEKKQQEIMSEENKPVVNKKGEKAPTPKPPEKTPETLAKNYGSFVAQFEEFIAGHNGTKAAMVAGIELADLYLEHKDPKKAVEVLRPLAAQPSKSELFYGLLQSQLGLALSDAGECGDAVKVFDDILQVEAQKPFHSQSLLRKGACLVSMNQLDEAKAAFQQARTEYPDTFTGEMAQGYERLIQMKKGAAQ